MTKKVLVVGGAGYIGSHVNKLLKDSGFETVIYDNLSGSTRQPNCNDTFVIGDTSDIQALDTVFSDHNFDAVMHFGALINARESVKQPLDYYSVNVCGSMNILRCMITHGVENLIFSSTAAVYGVPQTEKITEDHPTLPINPYGQSKLMVEQLLNDVAAAHQLRYCALRYFNAAGGDPDGVVKYCQTVQANLIPILLRASQQEHPSARINGTDYPTPDGTCVRDFIHVMDIGRAHILALKRLLEGGSSDTYNLGNGNGFSVREVVAETQRVTGINLDVTEGPRVEGDPPFLLSDAAKARDELGWTPNYPDLRDMIHHMWSAISAATTAEH